MKVQMKSSIFKLSDSIVIFAFLDNFNTACVSNAIHQRGLMYLIPHFMKAPAKAAPSYRMSAAEDDTTHKEETLTAYCQVVSYLQKTHVSDDDIAEVEADVMTYK